MKNQMVCREEIYPGKDRESFYHFIYQNLPIGVIIIHPDGTVLCENDWIKNHFQTDNRIGAKIGDVTHCCRLKKAGTVCGQMKGCGQCALKKGMGRILSERQPMDSVIVHLTTGLKRNTWLKIYGNPMPYDGETYAVLFLEDITLFKRRERHLTKKLKLDSATHVLNKQSLLKYIDKLMKAKKISPFTICMVDFDDFKSINDCYGHIAGDKVLHAFSEIARENIRSGDVIGRYGGEEFILIFNGINAKQSAAIVNRIQNSLRERFAGKVSMPITLSAGILYMDGNNCEQSGCEKLIDMVDALLYQAKKAGKNQIAGPGEKYSFDE